MPGEAAPAPLLPGPPPGPPWGLPLAGELREFSIESRLLRSNHLGDPWRRPIWVYLPPGYGDDPGARFPTVYLLQGMTGQLDMWRNRSAFRRTPIELYDRLFQDPAVPRCILVFVDCWTSLGGSQFLDSRGTGAYHSYLCDEVVPAVDREFRTLPHREHRGVAGKSSGGYGAMVTPLLRPDLFSAFASHAGDALFEYCYLPEFPQTVRALRDEYQGSYAAFWAEFRGREGTSKPSDGALINVYCMAACYSPGADGTPDLPFDPETGAVRRDVFERWLEMDPWRLAVSRAEAVGSLRAAYLDGGRHDEFNLELGATAVATRLRQGGVSDVRLELFEGSHSGMEYRYPEGVRFLAERLTPR